jgi:hypothetical protein
MKVTGFNHLSIGARNLVETVKFDETVLGMQANPSYNFGSRPNIFAAMICNCTSSNWKT